MAKPKIHWYYGCGWGRACDYQCSADRFTNQVAENPDWYCVTCATKARLKLAAESAPKPSDVVWPQPRPISEAPKDGSFVLVHCKLHPGYIVRHTTDRLSKEGIQNVSSESNRPLYLPTHFLPLPPEAR